MKVNETVKMDVTFGADYFENILRGEGIKYSRFDSFDYDAEGFYFDCIYFELSQYSIKFVDYGSCIAWAEVTRKETEEEWKHRMEVNYNVTFKRDF